MGGTSRSLLGRMGGVAKGQGADLEALFCSRPLVEFATLTIDPVSGLPIAHIFKPAEIDACSSRSLAFAGTFVADTPMFSHTVLEKEGLAKKPEETPVVAA